MSNYEELDYVCALDLETSGLDEQGDQVLEVAARFGRITLEGWREDGVVFERVLPLITDVRGWHPAVVDMHAKNGLIAAASALGKKQGEVPYSVSFQECDAELKSIADSLAEPSAKFTLLGNTVHFDLRFVRRVFPEFSKRLSHRVIDVSSIRLFCEGLGKAHVKGEPAHRAMPDVLESLRLYEELRKFAGPRRLGSA